MKKTLTIILLVLNFLAFHTNAQSSSKVKKARQAKIPVAKVPTKKTQAPVIASKPMALSATAQKQMSEALALVRAGQCEKAAPLLYIMSRKAELANERYQIKYLLGGCLLDLNLYQVAAFQFVDVIRHGATKYTKPSIEKLSLAADNLGDETLLNYAISRVEIEDFPKQNRDIIYFRLGEIKLKNNKFAEAAELFSKVGAGSRYFAQAKFNRGLAYLEANHTNEALRTFRELEVADRSASVVDFNKVSAQLAIARTFYQAQQWEEAVDAYRRVPRDSELWHEALFESSWAMFRAARFRSALSNFQSLHSTYYEDFYLPESLLLRSIVYLYICKYDEMDKVLGLFEKTYGPVREAISKLLAAGTSPNVYFSEIEKANNLRQDKTIRGTMKIPYNVARKILDEGNVKRTLQYIRNLTSERNRIAQMPSMARTSLGSYASKVISNRQRNAQLSVGEMVKAHLLGIRNDLKDLYEQAGFIRYEMINGKKETLKKRIAGKAIEQVDERVDRTFYVQNGYQYWPFEGEYWLDEIGNYHYLGKQSCE
jgi:tetratricopeptide (TPR) repeat protein